MILEKDQSSDNLSLTFNNNEINYGTDALNSDWHYWEVKLKNTRRNGPSFGLLGNTILGVTIGKAISDIGEGNNYTMFNESWVLDTRFSILNQQRVRHRLVNPFRRKFSTVIGMFLDRQQGTLSYYKNGEPLGVKHRGLDYVKDHELFPVIVSNSGVKVTLIKRLRSYHNLQDRCRGIILRELLYKCSTKRSKPNTDLQALPTRMKEFLNDGLW